MPVVGEGIKLGHKEQIMNFMENSALGLALCVIGSRPARLLALLARGDVELCLAKVRRSRCAVDMRGG